jgi:hypothetical protein
MTPMWSRAVKFANAYAFVALDALFTVRLTLKIHLGLHE